MRVNIVNSQAKQRRKRPRPPCACLARERERSACTRPLLATCWLLLLFLPSGVFCAIALCTYAASVTYDLSRKPPFIYGLPDDVDHGYGWSVALAWASLALSVASGCLGAAFPLLGRAGPPRHKAARPSAV